MLVQFAVQANMLANIEFEFKWFLFFYDSNVKIVEFRMFFYSHVGQTKKLSKHNVTVFCSQKKNFILTLICFFTCLMILPWIVTLMIERGNKIYIWNELHSIVVVEYKHSSISVRSPTGGMKKITSFFL